MSAEDHCRLCQEESPEVLVVTVINDLESHPLCSNCKNKLVFYHCAVCKSPCQIKYSQCRLYYDSYLEVAFPVCEVHGKNVNEQLSNTASYLLEGR
jgi:predicted amidophosphoribosyltransferase